jgi:hypothetical protein
MQDPRSSISLTQLNNHFDKPVFAQLVKKFNAFMEDEDSLLGSYEPATESHPYAVQPCPKLHTLLL